MAGRPSKGDRAPATYTRPHTKVREAAEHAWRAEGYDSLSDYISAALAEHVGMPELAPRPVHGERTELPLTG